MVETVERTDSGKVVTRVIRHGRGQGVVKTTRRYEEDGTLKEYTVTSLTPYATWRS